MKIRPAGNVTTYNETIYRDVEENLLWDINHDRGTGTIMMSLVIFTVFLAVSLKNKCFEQLTSHVPESGEL